MENNNHHKLSFPEVVVVEASAGSGKTYALAKRYLQLLINSRLKLQQFPLRNILAVTFTNKATIEMKERILEFIKRIALDAFDSKEQEREIIGVLGVDKPFAKKEAHYLMEELVRHYTFFQVQTIDSFINALLFGCALNIDRSASFKIKKDYSDYIAYCFDRVIEEAAENREVFRFFKDFLAHYISVENRSSWFPKRDILSLMQFLFTLSNKYGYNFKTGYGGAKDILKKKALLLNAVRKLAEQLPEGINNTAKNTIIRFLGLAKKTFEFKDFPDCFKAKDVPMNKGESAPPEFIKKWEKVHRAIRELVELDATITYNPYIKLFQKMLDFFHYLSKREDLLFLEELNYKARALFTNGGLTVAELYYRLATRFTHYLIDEFQDTSVLQWLNLEMMVKEALSSGGTLFYVGDKKQAIYRFRGGEAQLFDEVKDSFVHYNIKHRILRKNWRSQKAIVEFNNRIFSPDNLKEAFTRMKIDSEIGKNSKAVEQVIRVFRDSNQEYKSDHIGGYVRLERLNEKNIDERNRLMKDKLIHLIDEIHQRFLYRDIAILCRDNDEVELVTSWLLEANIPVKSEKTLNIKENAFIKEIVSFLKFLYSPLDDLSFASFIVGNIFTKATGISPEEITDFLFQLHKNKQSKADMSLYHSFRLKYPSQWEGYIDKFFKNVGFISPYELVVSIYGSYKVMENFSNEQAFFMKFLELIKQQEDEYVGLGPFLQYLENAQKEDLYVNVAGADSVHIITIHKSKGLEFNVVVIPFLRIDIVAAIGREFNSSYLTGIYEDNLRLLRITKEHRKYSKVLNEIYREAYLKACIDELNSMYVALTRAKFELYIYLPSRSGVSNNKARYIIPDDIYEYGKKLTYEKEKMKEECPTVQLSVSQCQNWIYSLKDEFGDVRMIKNREKILKGNILHTILSQIGNCINNDIDKMVERAIVYTRVRYSFLKDFSFFENTVRRILNNKEFREVFYIPDGIVYCEKEISDRSGDVKRIDRLIVKEKEVLIVDYKSSQDGEEEDNKQVAEYMRIINDIYTKKMIKGFLLYLDEIKIKEVERKW
jgi:ATP-dependent exoDNAse (exonuclease V) beta subunit